MSKDYNKPKFTKVHRSTSDKNDEIVESMKAIIQEEAFAVLATHGENEAYTSLISYVTDDALNFLAFSTPFETKKYQMIEKNKNVSLLIDNRAANLNDINDIVAMTVSGKAQILSDQEEIKRWAQRLVEKHQYLDDFVDAKTSAIVLVAIETIHYVSYFQEVFEWKPAANMN